jgi:hypothetical protein
VSKKTSLGLLLILIGSNYSSSILANAPTPPSSDGWIELGPTIDGDGTIYLSKSFSQKTGKFSAIPESFLDKQDSVEGRFLVGTYRTTLRAPIKDEQGIDYDELIASEVIDCENDYFGRLRTIEKLKGKIVRDETTPDNKINMVQTHDWSIDGQLCNLHQGKPLSQH